MGIRQVLADVVAAAPNEKAKGDALERLVQVFLTHDRAWADRFTNVWRWMEWPGRGGQVDTGIDLVAEERDTGDVWAIQVKFYDPGRTLEKKDIDSFFTASGKAPFTQRMIASTTDKWSKHAEAALDGQHIPVQRLRLADLDSSSIDWASYNPAKPQELREVARREPRPHQIAAVDDILKGFETADRGKLVMACGTGKTFTSLKIAEAVAGPGGRVLFCVPSISLLQQTLREWTTYSAVPLRSFAVCSDTKVGKNDEDIAVHDLMYPATTKPDRLAAALGLVRDSHAMTVVFTTYQSLAVIHDAQQIGAPEFDLIICDEAHRTTGVTLADADESSFVAVHDNAFVGATKRLYMTATPRIYDDASKGKAAEAGAVLASMDDPAVFGPQFHRLGFGEAVTAGLLSDYKVLVLAVDEKYISKVFQEELADENNELKLDDVAKIIGCWNGLAKRRNESTQGPASEDNRPMRRAVAFARSIRDSKRVAEMFQGVVESYIAGSEGSDERLLQCRVQHVDGTFNVLERNSRLDWLKDDPAENTCRILTNARCLSEGVDVPALDAVIFLNPRNSTVDVVQSVGRVMRKHDDKDVGYVILPIGIPAGMTPEEALADNAKYKVVWQVLNALRAHDDRFNAMVNKIELNRTAVKTIDVIGVGDPSDTDGTGTSAGGTQLALAMPQLEEWRDAIYAKIVQKVGDRRYWEDWAKDIADIAQRHVTRITALLETPGTAVATEFDGFLAGLRGNLNDSVTRDDAIEMLAQHLITRPVFDALFEGYSFAANNPVSQVMQRMLDALDEQAIDKETETLEQFYESVRMRAAGIDNAAGKQRIVTELYEKFFKAAFPRMADKLGIVYTPVEVVDYIIRSVQHVLQTEFGSDLNDEGVHVLDPFTGTGTFIVRLLESGLITSENLPRKYASELHANEIVLLAYYIAAINIEATYHGIAGGDYVPFDGIVLTDTFQMYEQGDQNDDVIFPINNERVEAQKRAPIRVILGNPPYSAGQSDANDMNQNVVYPTLDRKIARRFVERSTSKTRTAMYDAYIRAFRWALDRIDGEGIVAFVTNASWIDGKSADGFRQALADECSRIWVFNLRGNQRTSGEESRREGGKIFGQGSRTPIAITVLVKSPGCSGPPRIRYRDIGDYLTREQKLNVISLSQPLHGEGWVTVAPNSSGDWINQRDARYENFLLLGDGKAKGQESEAIFKFFTQGVFTGRDAWSINFGRDAVQSNMRRMIDNYNAMLEERSRLGDPVDRYIKAGKSTISWVQNLIADFRKWRPAHFDSTEVERVLYRPFTRQWMYKQRQMIWSPYRTGQVFGRNSENIVMLLSGPSSSKPFSVLATDCLWNFHAVEMGYGYPLRFVEKQNPKSGSGQTELGGVAESTAISKWALQQFHSTYGGQWSAIDIFHYVFGVLSAPKYQEAFSVELRKQAPRVPLLRDPVPYVEAGRRLIELQVGYESVEPWPLDGLPGPGARPESLRVEKMRWAKAGKTADKSTLHVNSFVTLSGIPPEALRYEVNGKSALDWLVDRYQVTVDKASGIRNDPNTYSDDPRYIVDLVARMVRVSVESVRIIDGLPALEIIE